MTRTPPIFDGTADTFDCRACGEKHPRVLPDEDAADGLAGGQGRTASSLRDGIVAFCVGVALIGLVLGVAFYLGTR